MPAYRIKVLVVVFTIAAAAVIIGVMRDIATALAVVGCGSVFVLNRHLSRCRFCNSWLTTKTHPWVQNNHRMEEYGRIYRNRHCYRCGVPMPLQKHPSIKK